MHAGPGVTWNRGLGVRNVYGPGVAGLGDGSTDTSYVSVVDNPILGADLPGMLPIPAGSDIAPVTTAVNGSVPGSSWSAAQILQAIGAAGQTAVGVFKATSSPSLIPGTQAVYNPATGQIIGAGLLQTTGNLFGGAGTAAAGLGSIMPLLLLGVGALVLVSAMGRR